MRAANASAPSHLALAVIERDPSTWPRSARPLFLAFEAASLVDTTVVLLVRVDGAVIKSEMINGAESSSDKKGPLATGEGLLGSYSTPWPPMAARSGGEGQEPRAV